MCVWQLQATELVGHSGHSGHLLLALRLVLLAVAPIHGLRTARAGAYVELTIFAGSIIEPTVTTLKPEWVTRVR